ncbi:MAG: hypothetical protein K2L81_04095, partial [Muribaculaceae bacterium]|nr:hypothetical protein [Muribaculaceae bacterium]
MTRPQRRKSPVARPRRRKFNFRRVFNPVAIIPIVVVAALVGLIIYANNKPAKPQLTPDQLEYSLLQVTTPDDLDQQLLEYTG